MPGQSATPIAAAATPSAKAPDTVLAPVQGPLPGQLSNINALIAEDIAAMNALIPRQLTSEVDLVEEIGHYIVESGGKRLRPIMVLLGARAAGYEGDDHIRLAAVIEFLHTATLLHDDVVDRSGLRRGKRTANVVWGNAPSVLVGDFLYSRAFQLMVTLNDLDILRVLSDATNTIAEGEVMQLAKLGDLALSEDHYMEVIRCKTALLFQAATHTAGLLAGAEPAIVEALRHYGEQFGLAYQLMDDYLELRRGRGRAGQKRRRRSRRGQSHAAADLRHGKRRRARRRYPEASHQQPRHLRACERGHHCSGVRCAGVHAEARKGPLPRGAQRP